MEFKQWKSEECLQNVANNAALFLFVDKEGIFHIVENGQEKQYAHFSEQHRATLKEKLGMTGIVNVQENGEANIELTTSDFVSLIDHKLPQPRLTREKFIRGFIILSVVCEPSTHIKTYTRNLSVLFEPKLEIQTENPDGFVQTFDLSEFQLKEIHGLI